MKLPIDALLPQIVAALDREKYLVIEAPPGAGKTARIPPALLPSARGEIVVLEPRRLAARMAARRVASELGERVGETVGYQVRFEDVSGPRTRIRFVTEGVLTRRLLSDPRLRAVVVELLGKRWSPEQVAHELPARFPGQPARWLCTESIYQAIYAMPHGELRIEVTA